MVHLSMGSLGLYENNLACSKAKSTTTCLEVPLTDIAPSTVCRYVGICICGLATYVTVRPLAQVNVCVRHLLFLLTWLYA